MFSSKNIIAVLTDYHTPMSAYLFKYIALIVSMTLALKLNRKEWVASFQLLILAMLYSRDNSPGYCSSQ